MQAKIGFLDYSKNRENIYMILRMAVGVFGHGSISTSPCQTTDARFAFCLDSWNGAVSYWKNAGDSGAHQLIHFLYK